MADTVASNLAKNVKQLRESRGLTQEQLSRAAGVPRSTCTNLESGAANPTISVLVRVAAALQVSVEELLGQPRAECRHYPAASLPTKKRGDATLRALLPNPIPSLELDRMEFPPGGRMPGSPHRTGTREYLACESGEVELAVAGQVFRLAPGDVVVFRGDQRHGYRNPGTRTAVAYSTVLLAPPTE